nr:Chain L, linker [synthetic construct]
GSGSGSGS